MSDYTNDTNDIKCNLNVAYSKFAATNIARKLTTANLEAFEQEHKNRKGYWKQNKHGIAKSALNIAKNRESLMSYHERTAIERDPQHTKLTTAIDVASLVTNDAVTSVRLIFRDTRDHFNDSHYVFARFESEKKACLFINLILSLITLLDSAAEFGAKRNNFVYGDMQSQTIRDKKNINKRCTELVERLATFVIEPKHVESAPYFSVPYFSVSGASFVSVVFESIEATIDAARKEVAACKALVDYTNSAEFARIPAVSIALDAKKAVADLQECEYRALVAYKDNIAVTLSERASLTYAVNRAIVDEKHAIEICRVSAAAATLSERASLKYAVYAAIVKEEHGIEIRRVSVAALKLPSELPSDFAAIWEIFTTIEQ